MQQSLIIVGLLLDIIGAVLLAHAIFIKGTSAVVDCGHIRQRDSAEEFYGASRVFHALREKHKTKIGLSALVLGFTIQIFANTALVNHAPFLLMSCVSVVLVVLTYLIVSKTKDTLDAAVELADRICQRTPKCTVSGLSQATVYNSITTVKHGEPSRDDSFYQKVASLRAAKYEAS